MLTSRLLLLVLSCLSLSLPSLVSSQRPTPYNLSTPSALPHTALNTLSLRFYPGCAWDLHAIIGHGTPTNFYQLGGLYNPGWDSNGNPLWATTIDYSASASFLNSKTNTFTPSTFSFTSPVGTGFNPTSRVSSAAVVLPNGAVMMMGGKLASSWLLVNDVIMSTDKGASWSQVTAAAAWAVRSDHSVAIQPGTTSMVLCGGEFLNFAYATDCWTSTNGASWTKANGAITATQQAPMSFLYDAPSASAAATLVMYNPSDNFFYRSTDMANTWQQLSVFPQGYPQQTGRMVADVENNLYLSGGVNEGPQIFFSSDKGSTWSLLNQITYYPSARIADAVTVSSFEYGCMAINYIASSQVSTGYRKQLVQFGGMLSAVQDVNSWFNCSFTNSLGSVTSVLNEIIIPGEPVAVAAEGIVPSGPNVTGAAALVFRNAASQILTYRNYPDCTYSVHAAINKSSVVPMWQLGGFTAGWSYIPSIDYSSTGTWTTYSLIQNPTYLPNSQYPTFNASMQSGKVAAGVAYLANGNLILFGGKDSFGNAVGHNIGVNNDVFVSSDNGLTWRLSVLAAPWAPRADMSTAVMPGTNYVLMGGGQTNPDYLNIMDFWASNDGTGAVWTAAAQSPAFGRFQDAAIVFMYDSKYTSSSNKAYSTLLINTGVINPVTNQGAIYSSVDGGMTFQLVGIAPWTQRLRNNFVADTDNNVFMSGGLANLGDVWTSSDFGQNWALMLQAPQNAGSYQNVFAYQGAEMNCMAIRHFPNSNSPGGFHKQLVLFGSPNMIQVAQQSAPECVSRQNVNVLYGEVMYQQEYQAGSSFTDTSVQAPPAGKVPTLALNGPSSMMPNRLYPDCGYDVHAAINGNAPMSYAMGGTDPNFIALPSIDRFSGSNTANFQTLSPTFNAGYARSSLSRWAAGVAVLNNGNVLWMGGKLPNFVMANDVWYSSDQGSSFQVGTQVAKWAARSDLGVAALPGTNCVVLTMGFNWNVLFNDVWSSCDGYGDTWTLQSAAAPWPLGQDPSIVALYDNSASSATAPTNTLILYTSGDQLLHTSKNLGATWTTGNEVPWAARTTAKFVADTSNSVYLVGGSALNGEQQLQYSGTFVVQPDVWMSWNSGQSWVMLQQSTSVGYNSPVTLALASYSCAAMTSSGGHRQLILYSGQIDVYNNQNNVQTGTWWNQPVCTCTSQTGIRSVFGDLVFPGETPNNLPSPQTNNGDGGSSKTFSQGQTAGIAVGVGVGVGLLCCLFFLFAFGLGGLTGAGAKKATTDGHAPSKKFEDEPSQSANVEMGETRNQ